MEKQRRPKPKALDRGQYRLAVYFIDHQSKDGKAYYFHSNQAQDKQGISVARLKRLVTQNWAGKVSWAGLYKNNDLMYEFKLEDNQWQSC